MASVDDGRARRAQNTVVRLQRQPLTDSRSLTAPIHPTAAAEEFESRASMCGAFFFTCFLDQEADLQRTISTRGRRAPSAFRQQDVTRQ
jgi:hypothetical protein